MVSKIIKTIYILMTLTILASFALADFQTTTITWVVPSAVSHSLSYGGSCNTSLFFFVEHDATIDGTQVKILPQHQNTYTDTNCQDAISKAAISLENTGNITIDANMVITDTLKANVTLKVWLGSATPDCGTDGVGGWQETCSKFGGDDDDVPTDALCVSVGDSNVQVVADLAAAGTANLCFAADFGGVAQGESENTLESSAWVSAD